MSGGESCATTLPSTNSTIEWTTLSGWTTTSICSGSRPKSQRASMTSSALFISVAESIEIFGPICQVGCRSASLGGDVGQLAPGLPRNGPARGGEDHPPDLLGLPAGRAWKIAECSLSTGRIVAPRRRARSMTSGPATTRVSLFASATILPASSAAQVPRSPAAPTIAPGPGRSPGRDHPDQPVRAGEDLDARCREAGR